MSVIPLQNSIYGFPGAITPQVPKPISSPRVPTTTDYAQLGQLWIQPTTGSVWILASIISNSAGWINLSGGSGVFSTIRVSPGNALITGGGSLIVIGGGNILTSGNITGGDIVSQGDINSVAGSISTSNGTISSGSISNDAGGASFSLSKQHGAAGAVEPGDTLGALLFTGWSVPILGPGTFITGAAIASNVVSIGANPSNYPTANLLFSTSENNTLTTRMTISEGGTVTVAIPDNPANPSLIVSGAAVVSGILAGQTLIATGDVGAGAASTTSITNVVVAAGGTTTGMIVDTSAGAGTTKSAGFLKLYQGTTVIYVPFWTQTT
jgi:hypothetical protein